MKKNLGILALSLILLFVASSSFGTEEQKIPEGAKVAGMPEVVPQEAEIIKAIPPSLKKLGKGKTIRNLSFQGRGSGT